MGIESKEPKTEIRDGREWTVVKLPKPRYRKGQTAFSKINRTQHVASGMPSGTRI